MQYYPSEERVQIEEAKGDELECIQAANQDLAESNNELKGKLLVAQRKAAESTQAWKSAQKRIAELEAKLDATKEAFERRGDTLLDIAVQRDKAIGKNKQMRDVLIKIRRLAEMDVNEGRGGEWTSTIHNLAEDVLNQ